MKHLRSVFAGLLALCSIAVSFALPAAAHPAGFADAQIYSAGHISAFDALSPAVKVADVSGLHARAGASPLSRPAARLPHVLKPVYLFSHQTDGAVFRTLHRRC